MCALNFFITFNANELLPIVATLPLTFSARVTNEGICSGHGYLRMG